MKATITSGELKGVEFEISEETVASIKEKQRVPVKIQVGQIYQTKHDGKYMVASLGAGCGNVGLTSVGAYPGCFSSCLLSGTLSYSKLRQLLIEKNAQFIGVFDTVFKYTEVSK